MKEMVTNMSWSVDCLTTYCNASARANFTNSSKTKGCTEKNPIAALKDEEIEHRNKMVKMEEEMEEIFKKKVKERTWKLEATELELEQAIVTEKQSLAEAREDLYFRKEDFDREKEAFESKQSNKDKESAQSLGRSINFGFNFGPLRIGKL